MPDVGRPGAVRPVAERRALRVGVLDHDVVHRDAQLVADDLRVGRLVALALGLGAHRDDDLAGQVDLDVGRSPTSRRPSPRRRRRSTSRARRRTPRCRSRGRRPSSLPRALRLRLLRRQVGVPGDPERLVQRRLVVAGVDVDLGAVDRGQQAGRVVVREGVRRQEVPSPDLGRDRCPARRRRGPSPARRRRSPPGGRRRGRRPRTSCSCRRRSPRRRRWGSCRARRGCGRRASWGCLARSSTAGRPCWRTS